MQIPREKVINLSKLAKDVITNSTNITSKVDTIEEKIISLSEQIKDTEKNLRIFQTAFQNGMENLRLHLTAHESFEQHYKDLEIRIESYVVQQLNNSKLLQLYVEKELLLSEMANSVVEAQMEALATAPFWKKFTKGQRINIILNAQSETQRKYAKKLEKMNERLENFHQERKNEGK